MIRRVSIMDKEKSLKRNYAYNLSYQLLAILVPLVTTPYVTRVLGPENWEIMRIRVQWSPILA